MIDYKHGAWGMGVLFMKRGSVIPKALVWSLPCATITVLLHIFWDTQKGDNNAEMEGINTIWSGYTFVLGFLIVFRSNQAYSRFWESVTLFHQITGEWTSAVSNLLSFCSPNIDKQREVEDFRQYLIRLLSLLHCNALQTICDLADDTLEVLNLGGIDAASMLHLRTSPDRCEIVMLWIERLIIEADRKKTLEVPPPILSRAFQELSRGMVSVTNVRKIRKVPFPFPYSQYLSYMLILHWILTPLVASQTVLKPWWAGIIVFVVSTSYWTLFYIAQEIDQPFGEDANDLPVREMQREFNAKLEFFVQPLSWTVPDFSLDDEDALEVKVLNSSFTLRQHSEEIRSRKSSIRVDGVDTEPAALVKDPIFSATDFFVSPESPDLYLNHPLELAELQNFLSSLIEPELESKVLWRDLEEKVLRRAPESSSSVRPGEEADGLTKLSPHELSRRLQSYLETQPPALDTELRMLDQLLTEKFRRLRRI
eukprot:s4335_g8.t1